MSPDALEPEWIDAFEAVLRRCAIQTGDTVAVLHESRGRRDLPELARRAAMRIGALCFGLELTPPAAPGPAVVLARSASTPIAALAPAVAMLAGSTLVVDCTQDGLTHAPELLSILKGGARVLCLGNEDPQTLARLVPDEALEQRVRDQVRRLRGARRMTVASSAGTDLQVDLAGSVAGGNWGITTRPGTLTQWPGGIALVFPAAQTVHGTLVIDVGDVNPALGRSVKQPVRLTVSRDHIARIEGAGVDAESVRRCIAAWRDRAAYAVGHIGYGLNGAVRATSRALFRRPDDASDANGAELRARAGNFLYSTGANEVARRFTLGHVDLPLRGCTIALDGEVVVRAGRVMA